MFERLGRGVSVATGSIRLLLLVHVLALPFSTASAQSSIDGAIRGVAMGRNTLRLPDTMRLDLRVGRVVRVGERVRVRGTVEAFNVANRVNYSVVEQRAFLVGTPVAGVTPLIFQDAATVVAEGLNTRPFGSYTAAATNVARERQVQMGLRVEF